MKYNIISYNTITISTVAETQKNESYKATWLRKVELSKSKCFLKVNKQSREWLVGTHTHTRLTALFPGLPGWAGTREVKPIWILLKQDTVSGSGISWAICNSAPRSRQITMPVPHRSVFLQARCPSCHPTNSVKALKTRKIDSHTQKGLLHENTFLQQSFEPARVVSPN